MQLQLLHIPLHRYFPRPSLLRLQVYRQLTVIAKSQMLRRTYRRRPLNTHCSAQTPHRSEEAAAEKKLQTTHQSKGAAEESQEAVETSVGVELTFATPKISSGVGVGLLFAALSAAAWKWIRHLLSTAGENLLESKKYSEALIYFLSTIVDVWVFVLNYQRETTKAKVGKEVKVGEEPEGGDLFKSLKTLLWIQNQYKEAQEEQKKDLQQAEMKEDEQKAEVKKGKN